jgi:hypothetical protein
MKCTVCGEEAGEQNYCTLHSKAYKAIVDSYGRWKKAIGISWKDYLSEIAKNPLTGEWAKEVAENLIEAEKSKCQEQ